MNLRLLPLPSPSASTGLSRQAVPPLAPAHLHLLPANAGLPHVDVIGVAPLGEGIVLQQRAVALGAVGNKDLRRVATEGGVGEGGRAVCVCVCGGGSGVCVWGGGMGIEPVGGGSTESWPAATSRRMPTAAAARQHQAPAMGAAGRASRPHLLPLLVCRLGGQHKRVSEVFVGHV